VINEPILVLKTNYKIERLYQIFAELYDIEEDDEEAYDRFTDWLIERKYMVAENA